MAALKGHLDVVRVLAEQGGADVDAGNGGQSETALFVASGLNYVEIVDYLVNKAGADANIKTTPGASPLYVAALRGHLEVAKILVEDGKAEVDAVNGVNDETALLVASAKGNADVVSYLVDKAGADVEARAKNDASPLYIAAFKGHLEAVRILAENGDAKVDATIGANRETALLAASIGGHADVVRYLVCEAGADIAAKAENGLTPLSAASLKGYQDVVQVLLERKC